MERFKSILAVLPEDSLAEVAFERSVQLARRNGAALTLVDVIDSAPGELARIVALVSGPRGGGAEEDILALRRDRLSAFAARARGQGVDVTEAVLRGVPFVEVIRMVLREGHDIVVKGATRGGEGRGVLKGFDMHLVRKCPCPVWMLTGRGHASHDRILAAVDPQRGDDPARAQVDRMVLELATGLAKHDGAEIHVVHAWCLQGEQAMRRGRQQSGKPGALDRALERERQGAEARLDALLADFPQVPAANRHLMKGSPGAIVAAFAGARDMDLIVMGTVGRTGLAGLVMGSTAEAILNAVRCSVLALKPEGFLSPVTLDLGK